MSYGFTKKPVSPDKPTRIDVGPITNPKLKKQEYESPGAEIGVAERSSADGGKSTPVKIADNYAKQLKKDWLKAKGYEK